MSNDNDFRKQAVDIIEKCVCKERNEAYGSVEENFGRIAELWMWWLRKRGIVTEPEATVTVLDVAQMIAFIKVSRKLNDMEYLDNWIDDAGYNACGAAAILKEEGYRPPLGPGMKGTTRAEREQEHAAKSGQDSEAARRNGSGEQRVSGDA